MKFEVRDVVMSSSEQRQHDDAHFRNLMNRTDRDTRPIRKPFSSLTTEEKAIELENSLAALSKWSGLSMDQLKGKK